MTSSGVFSRLITGIVYIAIVLSGILTNSVTTVGFVFAIFAALACFEFQTLVRINKYRLMLKIIHALMVVLLFYISFAGAIQSLDRRAYIILFLPYLAYFLFYLIGEMYRERENPISEVALAFFGHIYISIPLGMLMLLCVDNNVLTEARDITFSSQRTFWLLHIFVFVWLNDTGAYVIGSLFGKHKLFERISPKKTWEGLFGGILFTVIGGGVFHMIFPHTTSLLYWIILDGLVAVFSTWGDLFESFIKRTYNTKDSGKILPGHGGILDRIDSLLFAAIPAYIFINTMIYII